MMPLLLLRELPQPDFPSEYLLSRVRGRKSAFIRDWQPYISGSASVKAQSDQQVWQRLLKEQHWLYGQMNTKLRKTFALLFLYFELKTVILCLRYWTTFPQADRLDKLLAFSLLSKELKNLLRQKTTEKQYVAKLEIFFSRLDASFNGLLAHFERSGQKGLEEKLSRTFLQYAEAAAEKSSLKPFFRDLIELRNIMTMAKSLHWRTEPVLVTTGRLKGKQLYNHTSRKLQRLTALAGAGKKLENLEVILLKKVTREQRKRGRLLEEGSLIIDYLWRCYLEARNMGLLLHGKGVSPEVLTGKVIQ